MSTFVNFLPSTVAAFQFQPTIGGSPYNATVTWNLFGECYYLNLYDLSGNLLLCRPVTSSGPQLTAAFAWTTSGTAIATTVANHNVPVGTVVAIRASTGGTGFDGEYQALSTSPTTLAYSLPTNPNVVAAGSVNFNLNLVATLGIGWLLYREATMQFEFQST